MSRNPRMEEVSDSDSDPDDMDPSEFDDEPSNSLIRPANIPTTVASATELKPQFQAPPRTGPDVEKYKHWQCLYPVYFDAGRSLAEGRRVSKELAVENPLAREILDAAHLLDMNVVFEPGKTHPKDWANPGRVRVLVKEDGKAKNPKIKNSAFSIRRGETT